MTAYDLRRLSDEQLLDPGTDVDPGQKRAMIQTRIGDRVGDELWERMTLPGLHTELERLERVLKAARCTKRTAGKACEQLRFDGAALCREHLREHDHKRTMRLLQRGR